MFGRKLRSRLDLLRPYEAVCSKVFDSQQKLKEHHSKHPRVLSGSEVDPVLIRNYATGRKWLPATIESQTGPFFINVNFLMDQWSKASGSNVEYLIDG